MKQRPLHFESLEERRLPAVTAGLDASAPLPAPTAAGVEATAASDHLPVCVDLNLAKILEYL